MAKRIYLVIVAVFLLCIIGLSVFELTCRVRFLEDFSQAEHYRVKADFVKQFNAPMYELTKISSTFKETTTIKSVILHKALYQLLSQERLSSEKQLFRIQNGRCFL